MADTKTLRTRIALLYKTYEEWSNKLDYVPLKGEVCICEVPAETGAVANEPALLMKVGNGKDKFSDLPWTSAMAADVYAWAKKETLDFADLSEAFLAQLDSRTEALDTNTTYRLVKVDDSDFKYQLQSKDINGEWTDVEGSLINIPEFDPSAIQTAIDALENRMDAAEADIDTLEEKVKALSSATHFRGVFEKLEDVTDPQNGDIVIVGTKEYIYVKPEGEAGSWKEFGDEGLYATKAELAAVADDLTAEVERAEAAEEALDARIDEILAHKELELIEIDNRTHLYANGISIRIEDGNGKNIAYYETIHSGEKAFEFPYGTVVHGGGLGSAEKVANYESTMIIMNGGQVRSIYGGSRYYGAVGTSTIILNGGTLTEGVNAGGAAGKAGNIVTTGIANVKLNGGTELMAYGGGMGSSTVGTVNMEINGGTHQYVTAGGANGSTGLAKIQINAGNINCLQAVNRGIIQEADIEINGGTINNVYAGGETGDATVTGKCEKTVLNIYKNFGGHLHKGTYGGVEDASRCSGNYAYGAVTEAEALACNLTEEVLILNCN